MNPELARALIAGTDDDVARRYASLAERAETMQFGFAEPEYVVVDTETTGFSPTSDALIEIAAAIMDGPTIRGRLTTYVDPGRPIPRPITELTGIADADVRGAPSAAEAIEELAAFAGARPVIAHNAGFDQGFIQAFAPARLSGTPLLSDQPWIDTVEIARIALPRLRLHNLEVLSAAFCPAHRSSHRAADDVESLCSIWRVLLVALSDLPQGLPHLIAKLSEQTPWGARDVFRMVARDQAAQSGRTEAASLRFSLGTTRRERTGTLKKREKIDGTELDGGILNLVAIERDELEHAFTREGLAGVMYKDYEPRAEQVQMAVSVAEACTTATHRVIEAGTGVGKSMAYLLPMALFARRNRVTCGIATKTNALLDQLVYHELPRLTAALGSSGLAGGHRTAPDAPDAPDAPEAPEAPDAPDASDAPDAPDELSYVALKGYEHYPCLRKLMRLARQDHAYRTTAPLVLVGQLLAYVSQSATGDIDPLPLRWQELARY
ncbi:MAG: hypothetical protein LBD25_04690, partial [Coriobacteriales bacterium]|nr:hypothetical protein [Coriobacteriales bacterium]